MKAARRTAVLLEREAEVAALTARAAEAARGRGGLAVIHGPAGIGKTALLEAARRAAGNHGLEPLTAAGAELEREQAYGVAGRLLEPALPAASDVRTGSGALAASVLHRAPDPPWDLATDPALRVIDALCAVSAEAAARKPLLLMVDDAHWADDASLRFLSHLAARVEALPLLLVVAARQVDATMARLAYEPGALHLRLAPLSRTGVARVVEQELGRAPSERFAAACHEATDGIPLLARELARGLREGGEAPDDEAAARLASRAPARLQALVLERARAVSPAAVALAEAVAVLGSDALLHRAAALAGLPANDAALLVDDLAAAGVLTGELRPLRLAHPLLATALHDAIPNGRRAVAHARAADLLAAEHAPVERVAGQLLHTEPVGSARRAAVLAAAGRRAAAQGAPRSAAAHLRRALAELPASPERGRLLLELGCVESYVADPAAVEHLEAALEASPAGPVRIAATFALGRVLEFGGRHAQAFAILERTARELEAEEHELGAVLDAALLSAARLDSTTAGEAPRLIRRLRTRQALPAAAHGPLALAAAMANEPVEDVVALALRALPDDLELLPADADAPPFFYQGAVALVVCEQFASAAAHLERGLRHALVRRSALHVTTLLVVRAWLRHRTGQLDGAQGDASRALEDAGEPLPTHLALLARALAAEAAIDAGRLDVAERALSATDWSVPGARTSATALFHLHAEGRLALVQDRLDIAAERFAAAGRHAAALGARTAGVAWRSHGAIAAARRGRPQEARVLADEAVDAARRFGGAFARGHASRIAALVGPDAGRIAGLEAAAALLAGSGARLEHARALADLGAAHRRAGRRRQAQGLLREALDLADRCGAAPLVDAVRAELVAAGARPRRHLLRGPEALTASERRVATFAARGLTNRQIAEALSLAPRTVEGHLTRAFGKLGIDSRRQLAEQLEASD